VPQVPSSFHYLRRAAARVPRQFLPNLYAFGPTRLIPLDLSKELRCAGPATSLGLCSNFGRILPGETLSPDIAADAATSCSTSSAGADGPRSSTRASLTSSGRKATSWHCRAARLTRTKPGANAAFYLVHDAPLLRHLGVAVNTSRFKPTVYAAETTRSQMDQIAHNPDSANRSRIPLLLGNKRFPQLRTITHVVWAMYGVVKPGSVQKPHRHQSVALDFTVSCGPGAAIGKQPFGSVSAGSHQVT
jgi:hypothetical protein